MVTVVLPYVSPKLRDACLSTMAPELAGFVLPVSNTPVNRGVSWAWNRGLDHARAVDSSWLVLCSTGTRFGPPGGRDFLGHLGSADPEAMLSVTGAGWHLHAIPLALFDLVGPFDEWFLAYYEDLDWLRRLLLAGGGDVWAGESNAHVEVDATWLPNAHSIVNGYVPAGVYQDGWRRWTAKWGPTEDRDLCWPTPWNRPGVDWSWTWQDGEAAARGLPPATPAYPYVGGAAW